MSDSFLSRLDPPKPPRPTPSGPMVVPNDKYTAAAFKAEVDNVRNAPEGTRNHQLFSSTAACAEFCNAGTLSEDTVRQAMADAGRSAGLDELEIERTIQSAFDKTVGVARMIPERAKPSIQVSEKVAPQGATGAGMTYAEDVWGDHPPIDGAGWLFAPDDRNVVIWGTEDQILWTEGEALMLCATMGVGKTTLAGLLVRGLLGLAPKVLGLPVQPSDKPVLYMAMDRPRQIRRSLKRQFSEDERELFANKLIIKPGPPIADIAVRPSLLLRMAQDVGAGVVVVDSLKDAAVGLSEDAVGAAYNRARQAVLAAGIQLLELHHLRKVSLANGPSQGVGEVFGSTWLTAGAGSVILLSGEPGDPIVRFRHAKQPAEEVGPWRIHHDQTTGQMDVQRVDLVMIARNCGANGLTAERAAQEMYERSKVSDSQVKKAERRLDWLATKGLLYRVDGGLLPSWFPVENRMEEPGKLL